jgi:hypothetical protein
MTIEAAQGATGLATWHPRHEGILSRDLPGERQVAPRLRGSEPDYERYGYKRRRE